MSENHVVRYQQEDEIDLLNIFVFMKEKAGIFLTLTVLLALVGLAAMLFVNEQDKSTPSARAVVMVKYEEKHNVSGITSAYVLRQAIDRSGLRGKISESQLSSNIVVNRVAKEEYRQVLALYNQLKTTDVNAIDRLSELEIEYGNSYIVELRNGFGNDDGKRKTFLTGSEMKLLLNSVLEAYTAQFVDTYSAVQLPIDNSKGVDFSSLEYIKAANQLSSSMTALKKYCEEMGEQFPDYSANGVTYADIAELIETVANVHLRNFEAYLYYDNSVLNKDNLVTLYEFTIKQLNLELDENTKTVAYYASLIENFENENFLVLASNADGETQSYQINMNYYNELISMQAENLIRQAEIKADIEDYTNRLSRAKSLWIIANDDYAKSTIDSLTETYEKLYDSVYQMTERLLSSSGYKAGFIQTTAAFQETNSFFSEGYIKKDLIGFGVGAFLGIMIWGMYGLIRELRNGKKEVAA